MIPARSTGQEVPERTPRCTVLHNTAAAESRPE